MNKYGRWWSAIRNAILRRDGRRCRFCGTSKTLVVHHQRPLRMGGDNREYNLITLCQSCHQQTHADINRHGLATLAGPEYEPHREYLTEPDATADYLEYKRGEGIGE